MAGHKCNDVMSKLSLLETEIGTRLIAFILTDRGSIGKRLFSGNLSRNLYTMLLRRDNGHLSIPLDWLDGL